MNEEFDVFISYQWDIGSQVESLHNKLVEMKIKVWRDVANMRNSNSALTDQLAKAIKMSKIFLCCLTQKYSESKNCKLEINYANDLGKPMLVLAIERPNLDRLGGIGFIISSTVRKNCYKHPETWFNDDFESIHKSIIENLEVGIKLIEFSF